MKVISKAEDDDIIILSDVDEIPNLKKNLICLTKKIMLFFPKKCSCIK